jgi:phosphatidylinositol alpha-mannosyltransferase
VEAMAAGTAVIASDIDGYRTVSRQDREALLVPPGDAHGLRTALRALLDEPARRDALVAAGRERADEFSMTHLAERFLPLYERAIAAPRAKVS